MTKEQMCDSVIAILTKSGGSLKLLDISKSLHFKSDSKEYGMLVEALNMLNEQNIIQKNSRRRYTLNTFTQYDKKTKNNTTNGITGILQIDNKIGVVATQNPEFPFVIIPNKCINTAIAGDEVKIKLTKQKNNNKVRGEIIEIISRNTTNITGTVNFDGKFYYLIPDNEKIPNDFLIPVNSLAGARHGDKVNVIFTEWNNTQKNPQIKITEIIGRAGDPIVEYETIMKEFNLRNNFSKEVLNEVKSIKIPANRKISGRIDLRNETIITIDPVTAKDFDDALSLTKTENGNYLLGVHIADVSHYVKENSALDTEAMNRGNSVYLVDRVVPMLPEELSNNVCSLNPNVVRYTFSILMEIDENLDVANYQIAQTMIKSCRRFDYDEVQNIIDTNEGDYKELILELATLTKKIRNKRIAAGSIDYDSKEVKYILNEDKFPIDVEIHKTTESTALVEECMLLANKTIAAHIKKYPINSDLCHSYIEPTTNQANNPLSMHSILYAHSDIDSI